MEVGEEQSSQNPWIRDPKVSTVPALTPLSGLACEGTVGNDLRSLPRAETELQVDTHARPDAVTEVGAESNASPEI